MDRRTFALAGLIALIPSGLGAEDAQDKAAVLLKHDLVVTATRLETPEKKVGSSLTVVTGEELVRTGKALVLEALEAVLGLSTIRNGGPGATASVSGDASDCDDVHPPDLPICRKTSNRPFSSSFMVT